MGQNQKKSRFTNKYPVYTCVIHISRMQIEHGADNVFDNDPDSAWMPQTKLKKLFFYWALPP